MDNKPKRGLSALLAATTPAQTNNQAAPQQAVLQTQSSVLTADLAPNEIRPNPKQPRTDFDPQALADLAASIKARGLIQPVVVRSLKPNEITGTAKYELIAGERRWRASQTAGLTKIPAVIKDVFDDRDILLLSLVENLQRDDLNPIEEALAYERLAKTFNLTHEQIADGVGKNRVTVSNAIRLLELPSSIQDAIKARRLSVGHAKVLLSIPDPKLQAQIAAKVQAEYFSVRDLERLVSGSVLAAPSVPATTGSKSKTPGDRIAAPQVQEMERRLAEHLGTRVSIEQTLKRGRIQIEFYSVEDFHRIIEIMGLK
ncbi:MAG TPA: ParB/RepB/Spo0J family partition protein [Planctomycetota bacterium]|nr:ParB/RepB/Spo0J family partition protein [Planctomycetota bacterium]